jgi:hypothetical protein
MADKPARPFDRPGGQAHTFARPVSLFFAAADDNAGRASMVRPEAGDQGGRVRQHDYAPL